MLCSVCTSINIDELIPPEARLKEGILSGTRHHGSFKELQAAAAAGCEFCAMIDNCAPQLITQPMILRRIQKSPIDLKMHLKGHANDGFRGACKFWVSCQGQLIARLEAYVSRDSVIAKPGLSLISGRPISSDPDSEASFDVAKNWIDECRDSGTHAYCWAGPSAVSSEGQPIFLPTRLIDIGASNSLEDPKLILSSSIGIKDRQDYAALSHCWGGAKFAQIDMGPDAPFAEKLQNVQPEAPVSSSLVTAKPLTTESANIGDRMKSIPMNILPKTFQDSVRITRGLGLRYLWIDSLCIIQDSKSDWEKEAATMAGIYKHSYVTIAAESSPDSHQGVLRPRVNSIAPVELPISSKIHGIKTTMFIRIGTDSWETNLTSPNSKLCSRAWVLQESLLAPRTIHFCEQQMLWECRSCSLAEGDITPIPPTKTEQPWSWTTSKRFLAVDDKIQSQDISYLQWYSIIADYSNRKMTFSSDAFPALVGLATEFRARLHDQYVAGLWQGDLHRGLLWIVDEPEYAVVIKPYRAPSWSWASVVGQVRHGAGLAYLLRMEGKHRAEILQVNISPATTGNALVKGEHYGAISSASLTIKGRWKSTDQWPRFENEYYHGYTVLDFDDSIGVMFRYFDCGKEDRYLERHDNGRKLSLLHIADWVAGANDPPVPYFLVLESGDGGNESSYQRVGVVFINSLRNLDVWLEEWEVRTVTIV